MKVEVNGYFLRLENVMIIAPQLSESTYFNIQCELVQ